MMARDEDAMLQAWATTILELARIQVRSRTDAERHRYLFGRGGLGSDKAQPTQSSAGTTKRRKQPYSGEPGRANAPAA